MHCHLTDMLGLSQPTVSHHLRVLYGAGLVGRERRGNWVYYKTVSGALEGLREALCSDAKVPNAADPSGCTSTCACR